MKNTVRTPSPAVDQMASHWQLVAAVLGGTAAMRAAGPLYLPRWPNEGREAYQSRLVTATLFPAFARTVEVLSGKPFSKPVTIDKSTPARIKKWCENVDLQGRNLHTFAADLCTDALGDGVAGILVDFPTVSGIRTKADEMRVGARPYFVQINCRNVLGWKVARVGSVDVLTQLRLLETAVVPDGDFHEKEVEQVRVLYRGRWEIWQELDVAGGEKEWQLIDKGVTSLKKIPFVPVYGGKRTGFMAALPPLLGLAHLNVEHWQSKSDQQTILHIARVPILFAKMLGEAPMVVGGSSIVSSDHADADLRFVEHSGKAIDAGRLSILDLEDRMRQIGAELLVIKPGNTSITQTEADNEPGTCTLQRVAQGLENSLDEALQLMAEWVGESTGGNVQLFQDYGVSAMAAASMDLLRAMNVDGTLSDESLFHEAQRRGVVRPELTWGAERGRIGQNVPKHAKQTGNAS